MKNERVIRFGIIGCGVISTSHAEAIAECPYTELTAVSDIDADRAAQFANKHIISHQYSDYKEMLRSGEVDAVSICLPSGLHADATIAAAEAGVHVLCEKPLDINAERMSAMIAACRTAGVKLGTVFQRRMMNTAVRVKQAIDSGVLGKLVLCDAYLKYYRSQEYYDSAGWRGTWAVDGGGALMNQGVHGVDMINWLAGGVSKVFARASALVRHIEVEDTAVALVQYKNGAFGVIEAATTVYPEQSTRFELHGEKGTIIFNDSGIVEWKIIGEEMDIDALNNELRAESRVPALGHYKYVEDMALAILEDREPFVNGEEGRKAVDIIHAIYESARVHKEIELI
ncbi:Gfo/Idh/MocA family protein [Paenibacillus marinisediminis]